MQLQKIGLSPDDIKYVVASHMHLDHGGNIAKFPSSTIVLQKDEIEYAMWPDEPFTGPFIPADAAVLRAPVGSNKPNAFDMLILDDDMDLFGDGSVIVKRAVGHTGGHQMMVVRLPNTGTLVLTGDNVYFRENVEKHLLQTWCSPMTPPASCAPTIYPLHDGPRRCRLLHRARPGRLQGDDARVLRLTA